MHFANCSSSSQEWIVGSGATWHITKHLRLLSNYRQQYDGEKVVIGNNSTLPISECGDVIINTAKSGDVPHVLDVIINTAKFGYVLHLLDVIINSAKFGIVLRVLGV
jgi:hypothetical protein